MSEENSQLQENFIEIEGLKIPYFTAGAGYPVLFLHGWGTDSSSFALVQKHLAEDFATYSLDLPGFGQAPDPPEAWTVYAYADFVKKFILKLGLERPLIFGHSFGGRLGIILGSMNIPYKMVLVDSAGIRPSRSFKYYLKVYSYKLAKKVLSLPGLGKIKQRVLGHWEKKVGSADYQQVSGVMRSTFVQVVNEDLRYLMPKITAPTLLIWGDRDLDTPLEYGKIMEGLIPGSGLAVIKGAGHYSFLDNPGQFLLIVDSFLAEDRLDRREP